MISRERLTQRFLDMVQIDSPSKGEKEMADYLEAYLRERGISVQSDQAGLAYGGNGRNIVAHIPGTAPGMPIGFCAHMDQVEPCRGVKAIVEGDIIRTDGTTTLGADDKGGITAILEALEDVLETQAPHRDIYLVFTSTEEMGMQGAKHMDLSMLPCKDLLVVDATDSPDFIAYQAPAMESIEVIFHGKKAHAGIEPEKGINAIVAAGKAIAQMHIGRLDPETTSNIGRIEGGAATNIVTDQVSFTAEIRSHRMEKLAEELAHMEQCCQTAAESMGASCVFRHELAYPALFVDPDCPLMQLTRKAMAEEGIDPELKIIGGGSDANILAGHGYRSVIIGLGMRNVHTVQETLNLRDTMTATRIIRRMMAGE